MEDKFLHSFNVYVKERKHSSYRKNIKKIIKKQIAEEIFADLEGVHICDNMIMHKIPDGCIGEELIKKLKKKYLGEV